jgi:RND superfamily putative drug exporter
MVLDSLRSVVSRRPSWVVGGWFLLALAVGLLAPDLTRLAAEGQARMLGKDAESLRADASIARAWPDQASDSMAVVALSRTGGLTTTDLSFARRLASRFERRDRPAPILRVLGPLSAPEIAERLVSRDGTTQLIALPLSTPFVAPAAHEAVEWLQAEAGPARLPRPDGLALEWTGDAVIGRDYMAGVQTSLDRAALATVVLLLAVLLAVYRSLWLAVVPLLTIGVSLVITRGILAWMNLAGWEISPLVELFLVALLFGTGTDFCLFVSWRYGEHFNASNPGGAMRVTLRRAFMALLTSAGTVITGLSLMGTNRFKLFSSTGPSVAIGLVITLGATLTLTPALLVLLARFRPSAFAGLTGTGSGIWEGLGRRAMERPLLCWLGTLLVMAPLAAVGLRTHFVQDVMTELPAATPSARTLHSIAARFGPGLLAPLTVVLESDRDLRQSEGLVLIDEVSRLLGHERRISEVRSATQPLGSTAPLDQARINARLGAVNHGFVEMADGAGQLQRGLNEGAAKIRAAIWLEERTGLHLNMNTDATGSSPGLASPGRSPGSQDLSPAPPSDPAVSSSVARQLLTNGLKRASFALVGGGLTATLKGLDSSVPAESAASNPAPSSAPARERPHEVLLRDLNRAAEGAGRIAQGAARAHHEVTSILDDPVGRRALDRLLINAETVRDHPELERSFAAYLTADGRHARIDLSQSDRVFSQGAMDEVENIRKRLADYLGEVDGPRVEATVAGPNAESADIRALTRSDQVQSWFVVPIGVFLVLILALRDPLSCMNLVATMVLTYAFALGATHLVFVTCLGAEGLDWKVPYFLFVLLVAVGVDYNVFLMARLHEESALLGMRSGIVRAIGQTGGLISSAAAITACSFASFLFSPLGSLRQLGFALVVGIVVDALLVRPLLVPCGHWLLNRRGEARRLAALARPA